MAKKRTSLDSLFTTTAAADTVQSGADKPKPSKTSERVEPLPKKTAVKESNARQAPAAPVKSKTEIVKQTVYLPPAVYEQLRQLAFEERKKMHDYLVEGLDRVFRNRGLKPYAELSGEVK